MPVIQIGGLVDSKGLQNIAETIVFLLNSLGQHNDVVKMHAIDRLTTLSEVSNVSIQDCAFYGDYKEGDE